jgi:hypothetical protein
MEHLLSESLFPTKRPNNQCPDSETASNDSKNDSKKDPLSSQIWRLYTKAKDNLPNGSRLENMTWRMMAMTLNKRRNSNGIQIDQNNSSPTTTGTTTTTTTTVTASSPQNHYLPSDQSAVQFAKQTMPIEKVMISSTGYRSYENINLSETSKGQQSSSYGRTVSMADSRVRQRSLFICSLYTFSLFFLDCFIIHTSPLLRHFLSAFHHNVLIPIVPYLYPTGRAGSSHISFLYYVGYSCSIRSRSFVYDSNWFSR